VWGTCSWGSKLRGLDVSGAGPCCSGRSGVQWCEVGPFVERVVHVPVGACVCGSRRQQVPVCDWISLTSCGIWLLHSRCAFVLQLPPCDRWVGWMHVVFFAGWVFGCSCITEERNSVVSPCEGGCSCSPGGSGCGVDVVPGALLLVVMQDRGEGKGETLVISQIISCLLAIFCLVQQMFQSCSRTQVWRKKKKMMMKMSMMMAPVLKNRQIRTGFSQAHAHQTRMPQTTAASCFLYWWPLVSSFLPSSASADCESKPHRASAKGL